MLTDARVEDIFREMDSYVVELLHDPTALGPQYFRDNIAHCRNHLNRVSLILSEVDRERLAISSELRRKEALCAIDYDDALANDTRVRALASIDDRKATVNFLLREPRSEINELKDSLHVLDSLHKVVLFRSRELQSTMTAIKDQMRVMRDEIRSGSYFGDERASVPAADEVSADDLERLMSSDEPSEADHEPSPISTKRLSLVVGDDDTDTECFG